MCFSSQQLPASDALLRSHENYHLHESRPRLAYVLLGRITATAIDAASCYRRRTVAWSVGLCVCWSRCERCKNGWTDRDAVWGANSVGPKEPRIEGGSRFPTGSGNCCGLSGPLKSTAMMFRWRRLLLWHCRRFLATISKCFFSLQLSPVKNSPLRCGLFVNILWPYVYYMHRAIPVTAARRVERTKRFYRNISDLSSVSTRTQNSTVGLQRILRRTEYALWIDCVVLRPTSIRENVCSNSKKRKNSCFWVWENVKS